jgi:hypothetical protein
MNNLFAKGRWHLDADFALPRVPAIIKDDQGNEVEGGLLQRDALDDDIEVIIPAWEFTAGRTNTVVLGWRPTGASFKEVARFDFPEPDIPGDKTVQLPSRTLVSGVHELSYKISIAGNASAESLKKTITVDLTPPGAGQKPGQARFPDELQGVITDDYLISETKVECSLPAYFGPAAKDVATYYWTDTNLPPDGELAIDEVEFSADDINNNYRVITIDASVIRQSGQGVRYVYYYLRDLAGNTSLRSELSAITVDLTLPPENLKPARIPISARGLIDREHAREGANGEGGVTVEIDTYDNADSSHFIVIDWDGTELAEVGVNPDGFPQKAFVPWTTLTAKGLGPLTVQVDYRIRRGTLFTSSPSPVTAPVDFTIAGQDHLNAPALLNVTLDKLEVRGKVSNLANTLTAADYGLEAVATVALYQAPQPGERMEVFWGSSVAPVAEYTVQPGDVSAQPVSFVIPWKAIEPELLNPDLPVFYRTENGINQQLARVTSVNVNIVIIEGLSAPSFPDADPYGYLNCCAVPRLWEGVTVRVAGDPQFSAGDRIELTWQGCKSLNGSHPIEGATATFLKTLNVAEALNGFDLIILPFDTLIAPMEDDGSGTAQYVLHKANGASGRSEVDFVKITRTMPSGDLCGPGNDLCIDTAVKELEAEPGGSVFQKVLQMIRRIAARFGG